MIQESEMSSIIVHGSFGSPFGNWFPWLCKAISERGERAFVPHFPTPKGQTFDNWAAILDGYRAAGLIGPGSTFYAHSAGAPFVVKYVARRGLNLRRVVTVSGFNDFLSGDKDFDAINSEMFFTSGDASAFIASVQDRFCVYSDNDPHLPINKLESFCGSLSARPVIIPGGGHLNADSGMTTFERLLSL